MPILKNARHEAFAQGIAKGLTQGAAYVAAGYKPNEGNAGRLNKNEQVRARVAELTAPAVAKVEATVERTLLEMARLAYYDATDLLEERSGGYYIVTNPKALPEDLRRAIVEITQVTVGEETRYRIKLANKEKALEMLGRHLQMFKDIIRVENVFEIVRSMDDDTLDRRLAELERTIAEAASVSPDAGAGTKGLH